VRSRRSVRGRLVGDFVVLVLVVASLVLATMVSTPVSPNYPQVRPVPVPTPPPAQPVEARVPATVAQRPAPAPVPMPPGNSVSPRGQASQASALALFELPALAAAGLVAFRLWVGLPAERKASAARRATTACQECGS
jgi:hypothetical protein